MRQFHLLVATVALGVTLVAPFASHSPLVAHAASCYGTNCNGKNPIAAGCTDGRATNAITATLSNGHQVGQVSVVYSHTCNAKWTYFYKYTPGVDGGTLGAEIDDAYGSGADYFSSGPDNVSSPMVGGSQTMIGIGYYNNQSFSLGG